MCGIVQASFWESPPVPISFEELLNFEDQSFISKSKAGPNFILSQFSSTNPDLPETLNLLTERKLERAQKFKHDRTKAEFFSAHGILQGIFKAILKEDYSINLLKEIEHNKP